MSGELAKMQEYRCQYSDASFTDLMLLYEVVIELICKNQATKDEWAEHPNTDYVLYGLLKHRLNSTMYRNLYPQHRQPTVDEFLSMIDSIHDTKVWRDHHGNL